MTPIDAEFDRQCQTLLARGFPRLAGLDEAEFLARLERVRPAIRARCAGTPVEASASRAPFVLVAPPDAIRAEELVPLISLAGGTAPGVLDRNHGEAGLSPYRPLPVLQVPEGGAYAVLDIERGEEFRGVRPADALPTILARGRTPLTIHEGVALVLQYPAMLERNHCFMLSGSRRGDRRVPALWISGKAPKLGWCWDGNPHSWLGTASAGGRAA